MKILVNETRLGASVGNCLTMAHNNHFTWCSNYAAIKARDKYVMDMLTEFYKYKGSKLSRIDLYFCNNNDKIFCKVWSIKLGDYIFRVYKEW